MVVLAAVESLFVRPEPPRTVGAYLVGLLSAVERKNCWWLAERAGHARPDAMQPLLTSGKWDADAARDQVRRDVVCGHHKNLLDVVLDRIDELEGRLGRYRVAAVMQLGPGLALETPLPRCR